MYRLLTPILAVIVAIALFSTFIKPTFEEYKRIDAEIGDYEIALTRADELQQGIAQLIAQKNAISTSDLERLMALLPDSIDEVDVVLSLDKLADKNRMLIEGISVTDGRAAENTPDPDEEVASEGGDTNMDDYDPSLDPDLAPIDEFEDPDSLGATFEKKSDVAFTKPADFFDTAELAFTVTGTYEDFKTFIRDLEESLVLMDITKLTITPGSEEGDDEISSYSVTVTMYQFKVSKK